MAVPLSLYLFCEDSDGAAHLLGCLICRWLPAASGTWRMPPSQYVCLFQYVVQMVACGERDLAYATISGCFVCLGCR